MTAIGSRLDDRDIRDLSVYYASLRDAPELPPP